MAYRYKGARTMSWFFIFGSPLIRRGLALISNTYPDWQEYLQLRHTFLRGVPTNAQLTLTILRIGELKKTPFSPSPADHDQQASNVEIISDRELDQLGMCFV